MISAYLIALTLRAQVPSLSEKRSIYFAEAISDAVEQTDDALEADPYEATAALIVTGERESTWRFSVERCRTLGLGGLGTFGIAPLWEHRFPGGTCGTAQQQAKAALGVLHAGEGATWRITFGHYIGARAVGKHPEAIRRTREFYHVLRSLRCACSDFA